MAKKAGSGSFSQRHGSPDPDPHRSVMDPQHCFLSLPYSRLHLSTSLSATVLPVTLALFSTVGQFMYLSIVVLRLCWPVAVN
jgi:hypothetical protein